MNISREQTIQWEKQYGFPEEQLTTEVDRHRTRRAKMIKEHPEIAEFFGHDVRTAIVGIMVAIAHVALAWTVGKGMALTQFTLLERWLAFTAVSFFIGTILSHWLCMAVHEATHNLALPTPRQNKIFGMIVNIPCVVPMAMSF
jgi:sphingolipid delta-4 desaturase